MTKRKIPNKLKEIIELLTLQKKKKKNFELEKNVIELFLQSQSKLRVLLIN